MPGWRIPTRRRPWPRSIAVSTTARSRTSTTHLGRLFEELKRRGLYDRTLIVLTADHGEEFHEHGGWWHGTTLYDEQIHVPAHPEAAASGARRAASSTS